MVDMLAASVGRVFLSSSNDGRRRRRRPDDLVAFLKFFEANHASSTNPYVFFLAMGNAAGNIFRFGGTKRRVDAVGAFGI